MFFTFLVHGNFYNLSTFNKVTINLTVMKALAKNWILESHIDFEYKQYLLLAYLAEVNDEFKENKLYPKLSELIEHYKQLMAIKANKENLISAFPKKIKKIDLKKMQIEYENFVAKDAIMQEIEHIIDYSMPQFEHYISEGKKIYDFVEKQISIRPVGIEPIHSKDCGYLLLRDGENDKITAYEYQIKLFEQSDMKYRGISVSYIASFEKSITNTMPAIKLDLVNQNKKLPNPATYAIETSHAFPYEESFLPIAQRFFIKYIAA